MFFGLLLNMAGMAFFSVAMFALLPMFEDPTQGPSKEFLIGILVMGLGSGVILVVSVVLLLIALFFLYKGKDEFGPGHAKDVRWTIIFLVAYLVLAAIGTAPGTAVATGDASEVTLVLPTVMSILSSFFLAFAVLYIVRDLIGRFEKDLLYLFVALKVLVSMVFNIVIMFTDRGSDPLQASANLIRLTSYANLVDALVTIMPVVAYWFVLKDMKEHGTDLPKARKGFLPRPRRIAPLVQRFYSRPVEAIVVMVVVAILIGAGTGLGAYYRRDQGDKDDGPKDLWERTLAIEILEGGGSLTEGDTVDFTLTVQKFVVDIEIALLWEDEPDARFRTNEPDSFSFTGDVNGDVRTDSGANGQGGPGELFLTWSFSEEEPEHVECVNISITLTSAGDQVGPIGSGPLTITDDSNEYSFKFGYLYFDEASKDKDDNSTR